MAVTLSSHSTGSSGFAAATAVSASVTAAVGDLVLVISVDFSGQTTDTSSVADTTSQTWTKVGRSLNAGSNGQVVAYFAIAQSPLSAATVTATWGTNFAMAIDVMVFSGAATAVGTVATAQGGTAAHVGITTANANSIVAWGFVAHDDLTYSPVGSNVIVDDISLGATHPHQVNGTLATTTAGATTVGSSTATQFAIVAVEIVPGPPPPVPIGAFPNNGRPRPTGRSPVTAFHGPQAFLDTTAKPDPNPASFRSSQGPMFGRGGPNPVGRFRSPQAADNIKGELVGNWINVTPSGIDLTQTVLPNSFGTQTVWYDSSNPGHFYAEFNGYGIWKSTSYGFPGTWFGPINTGTNGTACNGDGGITLVPNAVLGGAPTIYRCNIRGDPGLGGTGIWKSTNGGVDWTLLTVTLGTINGFIVNAANRQDFYPLSVDPYDPTHLIADGHEMPGVLAESFDAGATWSSVPWSAGMISANTGAGGGGTNLTFFIDMGTAAATRTAFLSISQIANTYRTLNDGTSWTQVSTNIHPHGASQIYQLPGGLGVIFMPGTDPTLGFGVLKSIDYGATWTHVGAVSNEACAFATSQNIYTGFGWAQGLGTITPGMQVIPQTGTGTWAPLSTPSTMTQGPCWGATANDGVHNVVVTSNFLGGLWRYVEPLPVLPPFVAYNPPVPLGPMGGPPGRNPVSRFRSTQGNNTVTAAGAALAGSVAGVASLTASLSVSVSLAGSVAGVAAVAGTLAEAVALAGSVAGTAALTGSLSEAVALSGSVAGVAALSGNIASAVAVAGSIAGAGALTGALTEAVALQGAIAGAAALTGALSEAVALAGSISGTAALTGNLNLGGAGGSIVGTSSLSGNLSIKVVLAGAIGGQAAVSASLGISVPLQGSIGGAAALTANLSVSGGGQVALAGAIAGQGVMSGALRLAVRLAGAITGSSSLSAALANPGALYDLGAPILGTDDSNSITGSDDSNVLTGTDDTNLIHGADVPSSDKIRMLAGQTVSIPWYYQGSDSLTGKAIVFTATDILTGAVIVTKINLAGGGSEAAFTTPPLDGAGHPLNGAPGFINFQGPDTATARIATHIYDVKIFTPGSPTLPSFKSAGAFILDDHASR